VILSLPRYLNCDPTLDPARNWLQQCSSAFFYKLSLLIMFLKYSNYLKCSDIVVSTTATICLSNLIVICCLVQITSKQLTCHRTKIFQSVTT
jgi:hypothetical protein